MAAGGVNGVDSVGARGMGRKFAIALTVALVFLGVAYAVSMATYWREAGIAGVDYTIYMTATRRWLEGSGFYLAYQTAGPYVVAEHAGAASPVLYPPTLLVLLVPFTLLPAVLWWAIPIGVAAWVVAWQRPRPLGWPVLAFLAVFPMTLWFVVTGNPALWFMMFVALGTRYAWPAVLVLLKPTLLPFAFVGAWRRSWWVALAGLCAVSLAFLPMWPDYIRVLSNGVAGGGFLYSLNQYPMLMIPVVAWLGRSAPPQPADGAGFHDS